MAGSLVSILTRFLDSARSCPDFTRFRLSVSFSPPESEEREAFSPFIDNLYSIMQSFFTAASLDHGNMRGREVPYAASFIGTADTYSGLLLAGTLDPDEQYIRRIVHHFMHGIFS